MSAATAGSIPSGIGIAAFAATTAWLPIVPRPQYGYAAVPSARRIRVVPSGIRWRPAPLSVHSHGRSYRHCRHRPQGAVQLRATAVPGARPVAGSTSGPIASTTPAPSWPMTNGPGRGHSPSRTCRSEWQTPLAVIRTRTSPAAGGSRWIDSIAIGSPGCSRIAARAMTKV